MQRRLSGNRGGALNLTNVSGRLEDMVREFRKIGIAVYGVSIDATSRDAIFEMIGGEPELGPYEMKISGINIVCNGGSGDKGS